MSDEFEHGMGGLDDPADADTDVLPTNGDVLRENDDALQTNDTAVTTGADERGRFTNDARSEGPR